MSALPGPGAQPVVLVHGFGFHSFAWGALLEHLAPDYTAQPLDLPGYAGAPDAADPACCAASWPTDAHWVCWSLGGLLALDAILYGARPRTLALIAASPCMVRGPDWPHAIAREELARLRADVQADPARALRRFAALVAHGDRSARDVRDYLRRHAAPPAPATLLRDLELLERTDLREVWQAHPVPQLCIWGGRDALIPPRAVAALRRLRPEQDCLVLEQCAHAPMLSQPERCAERLRAFWEPPVPC